MAAEREAEKKKVRHSPVNEQVLLAAALNDREARRLMISKLPDDPMVVPQHAAIWAALKEMERRGLEYDPAILSTLGLGEREVAYAGQIAEARADALPREALMHHVATQRFDVVRIRVLRGPVNGFVEEAGKSNADPARLLALAEQIGAALRGHEDRRHLHSPEELVRSQMAQIEERRAGRALFPYGIAGLDRYEEGHELFGRARMIPGAKPGQVTVITGVSGGGKSTVAARIALEQARLRRRVLYGAWEPNAGDMLELMAVMSLGWSRSRMSEGLTMQGSERVPFTDPEMAQIRERMGAIAKWVTFFGNPFLDGGERSTNEKNLALIDGYVADSGCDVFVADLWERCLASQQNEDVKIALFQQQRIFQRRKVHGVLLAQQRLKDIEQRADKRPTREGNSGTSAWIDVADTMIGVNDPGLFKDIERNILELIVLKQRWGVWPMVVQCDWDPERGAITGGRTVPYDDPTMGGLVAQGDGFDDFIGSGGGKRSKGKR